MKNVATKNFAGAFSPEQDRAEIFERYSSMYPGFRTQHLGTHLQMQNITFEKFSNRCDEIAKTLVAGFTVIVTHTNQDGEYFLAVIN